MSRLRPALCVLLIVGFSFSVAAQEERTTPVVTSAASADKIRFAAAPTAVQMRIEVLSRGGTLVYDSDWRDGNIFEWLPRDSSAQPLALGTYRLVMRSKNLAGQTSEKEVALRVDSGGMTVADQPSASPTITLTAHDGETGQLIVTRGDLSFRFGDFLNRTDTEAMRLTAAGNLTVNGLIHARGVMFPDGTILTTAAELQTTTVGDGGSVMRQRPTAPSTPITSGTPSRETEVRRRVFLLNPPAVSVPHLTPRPAVVSSDYQFKVDSLGVHIGTTPSFGLDVAGNVTLASNLTLPATTATAGVITVGGFYFAHSFGANNTFLGATAGNFTMSGSVNTGIGGATLYNNIDGGSNTASGYGALFSNTSGSYNTASGSGALGSNTMGFSNAAFGTNALYNDSTGGYNTAIGDGALFNNTGDSNIAVGYLAGINLTNGINNIDIGNTGVAPEGSTIRIGNTQTRAFIAGIRGVTTGGAAIPVLVDSNGQLGTVSSSRRYKFDINSMGATTDDLMRLRPVTFRYLAHGDNAPIQYGLIAEEVADVYPEMVTRNKDGEVETVMYQFLAPMLLNDLQKQHQHIDRLESENANLRAQLESLIRRVEQVEGKVTER
jgi:hypothetical protein